MASSSKVVFTIEGNSSKAVQAIASLGTVLEKLPASIKEIIEVAKKFEKTTDTAVKNINKRLDSLNTRLETSEQKSKQAGEAVTSMSKRVNALAKSADNATASLTRMNAAGGGVRAPVAAPAPVAGAATAGAVSGAATAAASAGIGAAISGATKAIPAAMSAFNSFRTSVQSGFMNMMNSAGRWVQGMNNAFGIVRQAYQGLVDAGRILAQSVMSLGRTMLFFVTLPLVAFLTSAIRTAVDFEDAMIRVGKTTGLWGDELKELTENIRAMALTTSTSHVQLATMAEQLGQLGVQSKSGIRDLLRIMDMLAISTDLSADAVSESIGRIANAFSYDLNTQEGVKNVYRLAEVINVLENTTAASADEIVTATLKFAQAAEVMGIASWQAAALGASLVSMGFSEQEAGTALRNATLYMLKNIEAVQKALGANEKYNSVKATQVAIEENAVQVFLDLASAAENAESQAAAFMTLMDIGNMRGGRALQALANNQALVTKALRDAEVAWLTQGSLMLEYERAMSSTKNQMGIFRNNVNDIAITLGDALLPVINKIISILVPALQMLNAHFKSLSDRQKLMIVGIMMAVAAAGPLLVIFGQLAYSVALVGVAFGNLLKVIGSLGAGLRFILPFIGRIGAAFLSWPGLILLAVVGVLKVLQTLGVDIAGFFRGLAQRAIAWGENMAANIANGIIGGAVRYITQAIAWVANLIASFFQGHSPPKEGPLSTIDKWGSALMKTFLSGFKNADFGILSGVARVIERILMNSVKPGDDKGMIAALRKLAKARVEIAKLIAEFNRTGNVSDEMLNSITSGLGDVSDDVKRLIRLWIEYEAIQTRLKELEAERNQVNKDFADNVDAIVTGSGTAAEKVGAIRAAQKARNSELRTINEEEEALESQRDIVGEQLEFQKNMLDALGDQEDIFQRIAQALESMKKAAAAGATGGGAELGEIDTSGLGAATDAIEEWDDMFQNFKNSMTEGRGILQGFFDGLSGKDDKLNALQGVMSFDLDPAYVALFELGVKVGQVRDWFLRAKESAETFVSTVKTIFEGAKTAVSEFTQGKGLGDLSSVWDNIVKKISENPFVKFIKETDAMLKPMRDEIMKSFGELAKVWGAVFKTDSTKTGIARLKAFGSAVLKAIGLLLKGTAWFIVGLARVLTFISTFVVLVLVKFGILVGKVALIFDKIRTAVGQAFDKIFANTKQVLGAIVSFIIAAFLIAKNTVSVVWNAITNVIKAAINVVKSVVTAGWNAIKSATSTAWNNIKAAVTTAWNGLKTAVQTAVNTVKSNLATAWTAIKSAAQTAWNNFVSAIRTALGPLLGVVQEKINAIKNWLNGLGSTWTSIGRSIVQGFQDGITARWSSFYTWLLGKIRALINGILALFGIDSPSTLFYDMGTDLLKGLENGIRDSVNLVSGAFTAVSDAVKAGLASGLNAMNKVTEWANNPPDMPTITITTVYNSVYTSSGSPSVMGPGGVQNQTNQQSAKDKEKATQQKGKRVKALASGGISMERTLAWVAEKEPEAVVPLRKLPSLMDSMHYKPSRKAEAQQPVVININVDGVRSDQDIYKLAREVKRLLDQTVGLQVRYANR